MHLKVLSIPLSLVLLTGMISINNLGQAYATVSTACTASLDGSQEVPPVETEGTGSATMTFDPSSNELSWSIEFSGLSGPATAAHFHGPAAAGTNTGVQVNIGDVSGLVSPMEGSVELTPEQASFLLDGQMYINIHTAANTDGEIRGQVSCEPSPPLPEESATATLIIGGNEFDIQYMISGGTLDELNADPAVRTLLLSISSTSDGTLTVWLPSDVIDADDEFAVFVDSQFGNFVVDELDPTTDARVLQIEFENGAREIEIVGTFMVGGEEPAQQTISVEIEGQTYEIPYEVTEASVQGMTADTDSKSLMMSISSTSDGTLTVWLPSDVIDADEEFSVLVDGESGNFIELDPTTDARVLQIEFENGAREIEMIGTFIVPEFGAIGILVMGIAIVGAIVATTRFHKFGGLRT